MSLAANIRTLGGDIAVAVFFHEVTVALIVNISALKALAFLVLLNGRTVALTGLEMALELRTVGIACNTLAVYLAVFELSFKDVAIGSCQLATTVGLVFLPFALLGVAMFPHKHTLSGLVAFQ